jgi:protein MYSM1
MPKKKVPGRPKKSLQNTSLLPSENFPIAIPSDTKIPFIKKSIPVLEGEIIQLRKEGGVTDNDNDSDIDIGDDDECTSGTHKWSEMEDNRKVEADSDVQLILCNEPEPQGRNSPLVTHMPLDAVEVTVEVKSSECDSSEESVGTKDSALNRLVDVESQPVYTFPEPLEEATIDLNGITDEEKTIHWDFFEGRPSKTPERYVKIRNSIVQEWRRVKPRYLTKTSVRPMRWYRRERTIVLNLF